MKRRVLLLMGSIAFGTLAAGCTTAEYQPDQLTRVDVFRGDAGAEEQILVDEEALASYREVLEGIDWQPEKSAAAVDLDVTAVLFYEVDKNMPERLFEHRIAFTEDGTAEIWSNNEAERYAVLGAEDAETLQELFGQ